MKKNLSKTMAIGLAVALGSTTVNTVFASNKEVSNETVDLAKQENLEKAGQQTKQPLVAGNKLCLVDTQDTTNNTRYLFEIGDNSATNELGAIFLGKVTETEFNALQDKDDYKEGLWGYDSGYAVYKLTDEITLGPNNSQLFEIFQAGNGTNELKGSTYTTKEINYLLPYVITIKANAFNGKTITNDTNESLELHYLEGIEANGFAIDGANSGNIVISSLELDNTKTSDDAFGSNDLTNKITLKVNKISEPTFRTKFANKVTIGIIDYISLANNKLDISGKAGEEITLTVNFETNLTTNFVADDVIEILNLPEGITVKSAKISTPSTAGTSGAPNTFSAELVLTTEAGKSINKADAKLYFRFDKDKIDGATEDFITAINADINVVDAKATVTGNIEADAGATFADKLITVTLFDELDTSVTNATDVKDWIKNTLPNSSSITAIVDSVTPANKGSVKAWDVAIKVSGTIGDAQMADEFTEQIKLTIPKDKFKTPLAEDLVIQPTDNAKFNITPAVGVNSNINAGGYKFKVVTEGNTTTAGTVSLVGKSEARNYEHSGNITETNGYVEKITLKGIDYNVTQIGDGTDALTGSISTEDINKFGNTVTTVKANALKDINLDTTTGSVLKLDKVTTVESNALAFNTQNVKVFLEAITDANNVSADAFGTSTKAELIVPENLKTDIANKITNKNVTTVPASDTISIADVTINGGNGVAIKEQEITLTLGSSALYNNIKANKNVNDDVISWLTNAPSGITATIKSFDPNNLAIILAISGTPTVESSAIIEITVPQSDIQGATADVTVTENKNAKYNILPVLAQDDDFIAGGYKFKVLEVAVDENTNGKVALIEKVTTRASYDKATLDEVNGYVETITLGDNVFTPGKYEVTQIGDGTNPLTGSISTEDINKFGNTVTTVKANALKDVQLDTTNSKTIKLNKVTEVGVNAFEFTTNDAVSLYLEGIQDEKQFDANAFGTSKAKVALNLNSTVADAISQKLASNSNITIVKTTDEIKINDVTIDGKKNSKIQDKDIVITLGNSTLFEELKKAKNTNDEVTEAINMPKGLTAKIKAFDVANNTVTITISGTPTVTSSEVINIDGAKLGLTSNNSFVRNEKAKFNITETPTSGGTTGGSSGGSGAIINSAGQIQTTVEGQTEATTSQIVTKNLSLDKVKLPTISESVKNFIDIPTNHWASQAIGRLSSAGIIQGMPNGSFNANGNTKRADVAVMLMRLLGINETFTTNFSDINPNAYYANAVGMAKEYGIVTGGTDGKFNPNANISRQDTMVMIDRILDNLQITINSDVYNLQQFSDANQISGYAVDSVSKLVSAGIINGNNGKINPKAPITRAEIAVVMDKLYNIINENKKASVETTIVSSTETTTSNGITETKTETTTVSTSETKTETTTASTSETKTETTTK